MIDGKRFRMRRENSQRSGIALLLVAIVIAILSLGAISLVALMLVERQATTIRGDEIQVNQAALSGVELARSVVAMSEARREQIGGITNNPAYFAGIELMPAPEGHLKGAVRLTVLAPKIENGSLAGIRYGLVNESARLHLGTVLQWDNENPGQGRKSLMSLPGMTPSIADSILDWIDSDKIARPSGAELEYYRRIGVPYGPRNAIPVSLEELLLVRDVTRPLLFGNDETFSYGFDPNRATTGSSTTPNDPLMPQAPAPLPTVPTAVPVSNPPSADPFGDGQSLSLPTNANDATLPIIPEAGLGASETASPIARAGTEAAVGGAFESESLSALSSPNSPATGGSVRIPWCYMLTTLSAEKEVNPEGIAKFDLNEPNLEFLYGQIEKALDASSARFVILYRQNGPATTTSTTTAPTSETVSETVGATGSSGSAETAAGSTGKPDFSQPARFRLATPLDLLEVSVEGFGPSPFSFNQTRGKERFYKLLDYGTTSPTVVITGRLNINEALPDVLRAVPGLSEESVSQIVSKRAALASSTRKAELRHAVWIFAEGVVDLTSMKSLWDKITGGGDVFRCQAIGFFDNQGTASRCEAVIDGTTQPPRQVLFKDLTMYGRGFPIDVLKPNR